MTLTSIPRGSVEYLEVNVEADVALGMTVDISLSRGTTHTWLPAAWTGASGTTRTARTSTPITFGDTYPEASYSVYVRLTDTPETPIVRVGSLFITGRPSIDA